MTELTVDFGIGDDGWFNEEEAAVAAEELLRANPKALGIIMGQVIGAGRQVAAWLGELYEPCNRAVGYLQVEDDEPMDDGIWFYGEVDHDESTCTRGCCPPDYRNYEARYFARWEYIRAHLLGDDSWQQPIRQKVEAERREEAERLRRESERKERDAELAREKKEREELQRLRAKYEAESGGAGREPSDG